MNTFKAGDRVVAIYSGRYHNAGATGIITQSGAIDSENYLWLKLDDGHVIGPSLEDYWEAA